MLGGATGILVAALAGYLVGAIPTGYLVVRALRGGDLRLIGSGHTGGSNVGRIVGMPAGIGTAGVDALLGAGAVALSGLLSDSPWAATAAGVMAVVGHNWSVLIGFGGGIGLTTVGGALLWSWPLQAGGAIVALIASWLFAVRVTHMHRARATIAALALAGPVLWAFGVPPSGILLGVLGGAVAILKTLPDWKREYS
jgi:glycerol-3-phosphate acyltransferase PlsY